MEKKNNIYDQQEFFDSYARMERSKKGLAGAGEWGQLQRLFPPLQGKRVLDLGCGYGWHSSYAADQGAAEVLGLDISEKMIAEAKKRNPSPVITYRVRNLEEYDYPKEFYDCVISNLALHYVAHLEKIYAKIYETLKPSGVFLLNIEHPVFTAGLNQDWIYKEDGTPKYWAIDNYYYPGERTTRFLGHEVTKYHHTLTQILMGLRNCGFLLDVVEEAGPPKEWLHLPGMADEMRRPMMLLVRAVKD